MIIEHVTETKAHSGNFNCFSGTQASDKGAPCCLLALDRVAVRPQGGLAENANAPGAWSPRTNLRQGREAWSGSGELPSEGKGESERILRAVAPTIPLEGV